MTIQKKQLTKLHINIILIIIATISIFGAFSFLYNITLGKLIVDKSLEYLDSALTKSRNLLLTLSGIKASIAIIEGSTVGVSFGAQASIQLGDSVQSIYDAVDLMWKSSILGLVVIKFQQIFLTLFSKRLIDLGFFIISIILLLKNNFYLISKNNNILNKIFRRTIKAITILLLSIYILLPINILIMSQTSKYIDNKYRKPAVVEINQEKESIKSIRAKLETDLNLNHDLENNNNIDNQENSSKDIKWYDVGGQITSKYTHTSTTFSNIKKDILALINNIEGLGEKTMKLMIILVTLYLLDAILLPLIFLFITYFIIKTYLNKSKSTINNYYNHNEKIDNNINEETLIEN